MKIVSISQKCNNIWEIQYTWSTYGKYKSTYGKYDNQLTHFLSHRNFRIGFFETRYSAIKYCRSVEPMAACVFIKSV